MNETDRQAEAAARTIQRLPLPKARRFLASLSPELRAALIALAARRSGVTRAALSVTPSVTPARRMDKGRREEATDAREL